MGEKSAREEALCKLFVGGLKRETTEDTFREYFEQFGKLTDSVIICDKGKVSRGFGFVAYTDPDIVDEVLIKRPHSVDGKVVDIRRATPKNQSIAGQGQQPRSSKLFIGGLHKDTAENDIKDYFDARFSTLGAVAEVDIKRNRDGEARGFGFIQFENADVVDRILLEDLNIEFHGKKCNVKAAIPKDAGVKAPSSDDSMSRGRQLPRDEFSSSRGPIRYGNRRPPMPSQRPVVSDNYDYRRPVYEHGSYHSPTYNEGAYNSPPRHFQGDHYMPKTYGGTAPSRDYLSSRNNYDHYTERGMGAPQRDMYGAPPNHRGLPRGGPIGRMNGPLMRHTEPRTKPY